MKQIQKYLSNKFKSRTFLLALLLFITVFSVYLYTTSQAHTGVADADEMTLMGYTLSIAHPPGYPLLILLIFIITHVIPFGTIAFRASLLSGFLDAVVVVLFFYTSLEMLRGFKLKGVEERIKKKRYKMIFYLIEDPLHPNIKLLIAFVSSLFLAFAFLFWMYSCVAEVFALNNFFCILLVFCSLKLTRICYITRFSPPPIKLEGEEISSRVIYPDEINAAIPKVRNYLVILAVLFGLGLSHLQTILVIYPILLFYILFVLWRTKYIVKCLHLFYTPLIIVLFAISFIAPFLLLVYYNSLHNAASWAFDPTVQGFIKEITRQEYLVKGAANAYTQNVNVSSGGNSFLPYVQHVLYDSFTLFPLILSVLGLGYLAFKNRRLFLLLLLLIILSGPVLLVVAQLPTDKTIIFEYLDNFAIVQRQYIMNLLFVALLFPFGLYTLFITLVWITRMLEERFETQNKKVFDFLLRFKIAEILLFLMIFGFVTFEFLSNFQSSNFHNYNFLEQYSYDELKGLPQHALLVCFSDVACFGDLYAQSIQNFRKDVVIVPENYDLRKYYLDHFPDLQKFHYGTQPKDITDIISWNIFQGRRVFTSDMPKEYQDYIGVDANSYFTFPHGYVQELVRTIPNKFYVSNYKAARNYSTFFKSYTKNGLDYKNYWEKGIQGFLTKQIVSNGYNYFEEGDQAQAKHDFSLALSLYPDEASYKKYVSIMSTVHQESPYGPGSSVLTSNQFLAAGLRYKNYPDQGLKYVLSALILDPTNINARLYLAYIYSHDKLNKDAIKEYQNILLLDPQNQDAKKGIQIVKQRIADQ